MYIIWKALEFQLSQYDVIILYTRHQAFSISQPFPSPKEAFKYDVRCLGGIFDLPTYPNQILYYISYFLIYRVFKLDLSETKHLLGHQKCTYELL